MQTEDQQVSGSGWKRGYCLVVCFAVLFAAALLVWRLFIRPLQDMYDLHAYWDDKRIIVSTMSDGPFLVTHLMGVSQEERVIAKLPEPLSIIDSGGMEVPGFDKLVWKDKGGKTLPPPPVGSPVDVLYYRPQEIKSEPRPPWEH